MRTETQTFSMTPMGNSAAMPVQSAKMTAQWRLLLKSVRDAVLILLCAAVPAAAMYSLKSQIPPAKVIATPIGEDVLWIDARSEEDFAKEHIPGALSLNEKNWEHALPRLFETWQPPRPIIVYCAAGCRASAKIAAKLTELGIEPVRVMEGGYEEWKRSNG
jgi:rhodanese-related sulfurtransferase